MGPRIGSLFSGYGGLDMGTQAVLGGSTAWVSDVDKGANKILAHRYPDVPNLGDITTVDWSQVEPVDVLVGGFPCQDVSHAGKRAGLRPDTRTGLWSQMAYAIDQLRPALVVAENVRGLLSAEAHSDVEPCPWCVGDGEGRPSLRALGAVLGDLADIGYDASWYGLRATDIGAPHGRFRVLVVAYPASYGDGEASALAADLGHERTRRARDGRSGPADGSLLPTPRGTDHHDSMTAPAARRHVEAGNGTPRATDGTKGGPNQRGSSGDLMLPSAVALLPTPAAQEPGGTLEQYHARLKAADVRDSTFAPLSMAVQSATWGDYAPAITRWESLTRPAPAPTMTSTKGNPQLAPAFVEWMMGLPAGWVTDVPGITRNEALKALGNGVVPQQAEAALRFLLDRASVAA